MNQEDRINYMLSLLRQLPGEEDADRHTMMRGTSVEKLCEFDAGGYQRVITWLREKIGEQQEAEPNQEDPIESFLYECIDLYRERKQTYGESWKTLTPESIANLIEMKAYRAREMGSENAKSLDEARDMVNYAAMLYVKLHNK